MTKTKKEIQKHYEEIKKGIIDKILSKKNISDKSLSGKRIIEAFENFNIDGNYPKFAEDNELERNRKNHAIDFAIKNIGITIEDEMDSIEILSEEEIRNKAISEYELGVKSFEIARNRLADLKEPIKPTEYSKFMLINKDKYVLRYPEFKVENYKYDTLRNDAQAKLNSINNNMSANYKDSNLQYGDLVKMYTEIKKKHESRGFLDYFFSFRKHGKEKKLLNDLKDIIKKHPKYNGEDLDKNNVLDSLNVNILDNVNKDHDQFLSDEVERLNNEQLANYNDDLHRYENVKKECKTIIEKYKNFEITTKENYITDFTTDYYDKMLDDVKRRYPDKFIDIDKNIKSHIEQLTRDDNETFDMIKESLNKEMNDFVLSDAKDIEVEQLDICELDEDFTQTYANDEVSNDDMSKANDGPVMGSDEDLF